MSQRHLSTRVLVAAITTLMTVSLAGASGLVLCLGADGHRTIELEHDGTECRTLASPEGRTGVSVPSAAPCFDLASAGVGPIALSSFDAERVPDPPLAFLAVRREDIPRIEARLSASMVSRAGSPNLALHLASTILLV